MAQEEPAAPLATIGDFLKLDIRVGTVVRAEAFPEARKPAVVAVLVVHQGLRKIRMGPGALDEHELVDAMVGQLVQAHLQEVQLR